MMRRLAWYGMAGVAGLALCACAAALLSGAASPGGADPRVAADGATTNAVTAKVSGDPLLKGLSLNVETAGSIVTLRGTVPKAEQKAAAERDARSVKGVTGVRNELLVR